MIQQGLLPASSLNLEDDIRGVLRWHEAEPVAKHVRKFRLKGGWADTDFISVDANGTTRIHIKPKVSIGYDLAICEKYVASNNWEEIQ